METVQRNAQAPLPYAPRIMTTTELAKTGILSMGTIRAGIKEGWIPHIMRGNRALINYDKLLRVLEDF